MPPERPTIPAWIEHCSDEDLSFARRMILAGGSLKDLAAEYGVSYPTIRLRLDRLIDRIKLVEQFQQESPMEVALRLAYAEGKMDLSTLKALLALYRAACETGSAAPQGSAPTSVPLSMPRLNKKAP